jgi:hypothetical protein
MADKVHWNRVLLVIGLILSANQVGWFFIRPEGARLFAPVMLIVAAACNSSSISAGLNIQYSQCPQRGGTTLYLGVTAAVSFAVGYCGVLLGAAAQPLLELAFPRKGIAVLYLASAVCCALTIVYGYFHLPRNEREKRE